MKNPGLKILLTPSILAVIFVFGLYWYRNCAFSDLSISLLPASSTAESGERLNVNTATFDQLCQLPGIGPELAQRIIDYRNTFGPFTHVAQLTFVKGIGASKLESILDNITVEQEDTP